MRDRAADMPTQPLPVIRPHTECWPGSGVLAFLAGEAWLAAGILLAAQGTVTAAAPGGVRVAVWVSVCACLLVGLLCAGACMASLALSAIRAAKRPRRRPRLVPPPREQSLAAYRDECRDLAERAARLHAEPGSQQPYTGPRLVDARQVRDEHQGAAG